MNRDDSPADSIGQGNKLVFHHSSTDTKRQIIEEEIF
jgi:hypothetical protein